MANELIEVSILIAALNKESGEAKRLLRQMNPHERGLLWLAVNRIDGWIDDVEQDAKETAIGTGKEAEHG